MKRDRRRTIKRRKRKKVSRRRGRAREGQGEDVGNSVEWGCKVKVMVRR